MSAAERVIAKFGGQTALAAALGAPPTTVHYWAKIGTIPAKRQAAVLAAARERGIELHPGDFIDEVALALSKPAPIEGDRLPIAQWQGLLSIGDAELPVYVLEDGRRVMSKTGATELLSGVEKGGSLISYVGAEAVRAYIPPDLNEHFVEFVIPGSGKNGVGMTAEMFLEICTAYVKALRAGTLKTIRQQAIAAKASMFLASCAKVGLVALIDEATGYQYVRAEDALRFKLKLFLEDEMRKWESTFPDELWREFGRLTHWQGSIAQRPKYWGRLVMELIYDYLDPDVADWLRKNNPEPQKGRNHHQWLSNQYGLKRLMEHIWMVIGMAKACYSMSELKGKMAEMYGRQPVQITMFLPPPTNPAQPPVRRSRKSSTNETGASEDSPIRLPL